MSRIILDVIADSIVIWDFELATKFYNNGFYGRPLGIRKAIPGQDVTRPLVLSLFDSLYLFDTEIIGFRLDGEIIDREQFIAYANSLYENFILKYGVYKELRDKGYVVRPGLKFGTDFIVYEKGPGIDHSKYAVHVEDDDISLKAISIVRAGRLAHSVKKEFLIAAKYENRHRYFSFSRFKL